MNNKIEVNKIKEIYPGHFFILLDFPVKEDLYKIIDLSYRYVWNFNHVEKGVAWEEYTYNLYGELSSKMDVNVRNMQLEYLISTEDFIKLIPSIKGSVNIIQTNIVPPPYLRLENFEGKSRYNLLKEKINYLFEMEMPGNVDYTPIISPNKAFLNDILGKIK